LNSWKSLPSTSRDHLAHVVGLPRVGRNHAVQAVGRDRWLAWLADLPRRLRLSARKVANDFPADGEGMVVVQRVVVGHA
jgi:hypothetical protein